ncbi:hypothetical protein RB595_009961 [Gaeumannomyces hyphopodioides]
MPTQLDNVALDWASENVSDSSLPAPATPKRSASGRINGSINGPRVGFNLPNLPHTPTKSMSKVPQMTPRLKKKVPWKGKNILILLPRDDDRGKAGHAPMPLTQDDVSGIMHDWEKLGYNTRPFELEPTNQFAEAGNYSQSRREWPTWDDIASERQKRSYKVTLPDLNAWKSYVEELQEAKLRALGVTLGGDEAPPPSLSPLSRQPSVTHYPPLPFSSPLGTPSAASNGQFPFPAQFVSSGNQSPNISGVASPVSFNGKFNPRQSISIPAGAFQMSQGLPSPHAFSPQAMMFHHGHARGGSPSLANLSSMMSPTSPFQPDGFQPPMHQRHQSLQYPMLQHQHFQGARASPRLQELREDEEEVEDVVPSKTPEPGVIGHNASNSLQREIDAAEYQLEANDAEYHLEEQMRSQLEHDKDYSPHADKEDIVAAVHAREPSVQFAPQVERFRDDSKDGSILHHPQPHSRGHSLSQKYFHEPEEQSTDENGLNGPNQHKEVLENGVDAGVNGNSKGAQPHQRAFSNASNPWSETGSDASRRPGHKSKASLSGLNVEAPEFKFNPSSSFKPTQFNPTNTFKPAQFNFPGDTFQPTTVFQAGTNAPPKPPLSAQSSQFSFGSSKINANAPVFSPGHGDFNFLASGPKFRPDAPAFKPQHSLANSVSSQPLSGSESVNGNRSGSIFGNIDVDVADTESKRTKAIPVVPTSSEDQQKEEPETQYDQEGRVVDESRVKRAKAAADDVDDVPLFAEPTAPSPVTETQPEEHPQTDNIHVDVKSGDENGGDTALSSIVVSESTDAKATTSPSEISMPQSTINWTPFEFKSQLDMQSFNASRPFGEDSFVKGHKKSLSATAKPFVPGGLSFEAEPAAIEPEYDSMDDEQEFSDAREDEAETSDADETRELEAPGMSEPPTPTDLNLTETPADSTPSPQPVLKRGLESSRFAASPSPQSASPPPPRKVSGLAASRYAISPPELSEEDGAANDARGLSEDEQPLVVSPQLDDAHASFDENLPVSSTAEPTVEEIDDILHQLNSDPSGGVNRTIDTPQWHHPSPKRQFSLAAVTNSSPLHLAAPHDDFRSEAPSPSPGRFDAHQQPIRSTELDDPFVDPPAEEQQFSESNVHHLQGSETVPDSDWDGAFTEEEQAKLESRINFFNGHVNEVVDDLLARRLQPMERALHSLQQALTGSSRRPNSSRLDRRSTSADIQHSDADDEDDDMPAARRSMSPRRDRRMDQIRAAVMEALAAQQRNVSETTPAPQHPEPTEGMVKIMHAVDEMREQFSKSLHLDFRGEDLRNIVEDAVERRMVPTPQPVVVKGHEELSDKLNELQAKAAELEHRLRLEESKVEKEVTARRAAEDHAAELDRQLQMAETKIEMDLTSRSVFDHRVTDLDDRLKQHEAKTEEEIENRRKAEDRLSEVQRLLRISSEEETRLREAFEEKEQKLKGLEETRGKTSMKLALLEASQTNNQKSHLEFQNHIGSLETELREARQEVRTWKTEAERVNSIARQQGGDLAQLTDQNKQLKKIVDSLGIQIEENERIRDSWRAKFVTLQDEVAKAAGQITEESARRAKREQELLARQEVLDAKLQAEARTRERLESELERLELGERQGMRAVSECKRLEGLLAALRTENHQLQQTSLRYQAEFQEARESAAREVQRTHNSMQSEVEDANHQVNVVREELEDQIQRARAQLDQVKLDADTAKAKHEMLLEESQSTLKTQLEALARKHQNEMEDLQARHDRALNNTTEDAQRAEQNLLERLSISTSKSKNLQERVEHLEEKLEIAKEAARAAAKAAKIPPHQLAALTEPSLQPAMPFKAAVTVPRSLDLPGKISPQALRESIMVLQEQLQAREQRIEELEQVVSKADPHAESKISKRDEEITWLRELLAVRHSDLQDIIAALDSEEYDPIAVKDGAIRLKANLQMEEQERERAMNGGSAINLPNIAASLRDAATPRVAQAVGPLAAAWGNWRKSRDPAGLATASAPGRSATPAKNGAAAQGGFLSGLLTPPASSMRQTPQNAVAQQPTAFSNTGRRLTAQQLANRGRTASSSSSASTVAARQASGSISKMNAGLGTPQRHASRGPPMTPPMMRKSSYDSDAHAEEFDDAGFYEDE